MRPCLKRKVQLDGVPSLGIGYKKLVNQLTTGNIKMLLTILLSSVERRVQCQKQAGYSFSNSTPVG